MTCDLPSQRRPLRHVFARVSLYLALHRHWETLDLGFGINLSSRHPTGFRCQFQDIFLIL